MYDTDVEPICLMAESASEKRTKKFEGGLSRLSWSPTVAQRVPAHPAAKPGSAIAHTKANGSTTFRIGS